MRAVWGLCLLVLPALVCGQSLDEAARSLVARVSSHLTPVETAQIASRNISSLPAADAARAQAAVERALRKRVRNPMPVPVALTISENLKGYLLVAEIRGSVEMAAFRPEPAVAPVRAGIVLEKKLLWEQGAPILDVFVKDDEMLVLDTAAMTRYVRRQAVESTPVHAASRDPRGQLAPDGTFQILDRNTLPSQNYSEAQFGDEFLAAEQDGRTHVYDAARKPVGVFDDWGSDFAIMQTCAGPRIVAASPNDAKDSIALYDLANHAPVRVSDPVEFSGPVTALFPALAVTHNLVTGRYEAYSLTVDCGR